MMNSEQIPCMLFSSTASNDKYNVPVDLLVVKKIITSEKKYLILLHQCVW